MKLVWIIAPLVGILCCQAQVPNPRQSGRRFQPNTFGTPLPANFYDRNNNIYENLASIDPSVGSLSAMEQFSTYLRLRDGLLTQGMADSQSAARAHAQSKQQHMDRDRRGSDRRGSTRFHYNHLYNNGASMRVQTTAEVLTRGFDFICRTLNVDDRTRMWLESLATVRVPNQVEAAVIFLIWRHFQMFCGEVPRGCRNHRYRTIDGSCNNLFRPTYGKAGISMRRFLPAKYDDGCNSPRTRSVTNSLLPSPRAVSLAVMHSQAPRTDATMTHFVMQWGQFVDHDITLTPMVKNNNVQISCCASDILPFGTPQAQLDELQRQLDSRSECFPIKMDVRDPMFPRRGCMNFVRSSMAPKTRCLIGSREQTNDLSAYIDASNVYGSSGAKARQLRTMRDGRLNMQRIGNGDYLMDDPESKCFKSLPTHKCFLAGDERVNEQPGLTSMHTLFTHEHNRIAAELKRMWGPQAGDQELYQETRKIIGGIMQHITYSEFLPVVLGQGVMDEFGLTPRTRGFFRGYSPFVDASMRNSFSTAAYRFGHTLIADTMIQYNWNNSVMADTPMRQLFEKPHRLYAPHAQGMSAFLRGLTKASSGRADNELSNEITNHLFESMEQIGLDLPALNIQRGRDHGLPSYVDFRKLFKLSIPRTFDDLTDMPFDVRRKLQSVYADVRDIDLFVGGISERPGIDGQLGQVFSRILATQFRLLKKGDRFFYENGGQRGFTRAQLTAIRGVRLSTILCRSVRFQSIQPFVLKQPNSQAGNFLRPCTRIPQLNLSAWRRRSSSQRPRGNNRFNQIPRG